MRPGQRAVDLAGSALGLLLLSPVFLAVAAVIRLEGGGPVFYRQVRVGRHGVPFRIWKFRTMVVGADRQGSLLTVGRDARVTRSGEWLRRLKLDELPQLLNVLAGEMSLVGPRPETPDHVALYSEEQRRVLGYTPGITDPATLAYRHESDLLATYPDAERAYREILMPEKIRINLEYAERATLRSDLGVILLTLTTLFRSLVGLPAAVTAPRTAPGTPPTATG